MKFLIFLITMAFIQDLAWANLIGQEVNITRNMCFQSAGITEDTKRKIQNNDNPGTQDTHRYMKCIFENLELWNEVDGIRDSRLNEILDGQRDRSNILYFVRKCNEDSRTEETDVWLYNTVDCISHNGNIGAVLNNILTGS